MHFSCKIKIFTSLLDIVDDLQTLKYSPVPFQCAHASARKFTLKSCFCPAVREASDNYSTRFRDCLICLISASGIIWRLARTNACAISSISTNLGLGIGGLITGVLMRPRSQTAVLYRTCRRPMSSNMLHRPSVSYDLKSHN